MNKLFIPKPLNTLPTLLLKKYGQFNEINGVVNSTSNIKDIKRKNTSIGVEFVMLVCLWRIVG